MLIVKDGQVTTSTGDPVQLRGVSIGGWLNMEDFIIGYPGAEHTLRSQFAEILGGLKANVFFERLTDHFFTEADVGFIKAQGANLVRLPLNYRHFESDITPFEYLQQGFERLDTVIAWCARNQLHVILDLHAAQGWQSSRWHCDNANARALLWEQSYYQERVIAFWGHLAERYRDSETVIAYELLNEPVTGWANGHNGQEYLPNWDAINQLYARTIRAIRDVDPHHIIVVEGDERGCLFSGLSEPPDANLLYSSHNYTRFTLSAPQYPATLNGQTFDRDYQEQIFLQHEGTRFARQYDVPLWIGEFGVMYNVERDHVEARLRALDDQISIFEAHRAHWSLWTYKDVGVMGWVQLDPESDYMQLIAPMVAAKQQFNADFGTKYLPAGGAQRMMQDMLRLMNATMPAGEVVSEKHQPAVVEQTIQNLFGILMQPAFARLFRGLSESQLDDVLRAFRFENCRVHAGLNEVLSRHFDG